MPENADSYDLTFAEVRKGIALCKANARRLLSDASVLLDWDEAQRVWLEPEPDLRLSGLVGYVTIDRKDLRQAIEALKNKLTTASSP